MKFIALTYDYDLNKLSDIGRKWARDVYRDKDFVFEYSAASYASFIHHNEGRQLHLYTDDIALISDKLSKYNINHDMIVYHDFSSQLSEMKPNIKYSFDVLTNFIYHARDEDGFTVKVDNDLVFRGRIPDHTDNQVFVWKYERLVSQGDPRMGEIKVCNETVGTTNFRIYNLGVLGIPPNYPKDELIGLCDDMVNVDISDVSDLNVSIWHCSEQTANNWLFHKYNYDVIETHNIVNHHFDNKHKCIDEVKYLLI